MKCNARERSSRRSAAARNRLGTRLGQEGALEDGVSRRCGHVYDRIGLGDFEASYLNNGVNQLQYTVYNPTFYTNNVPSLSSLSAGENAKYVVDPKLRADYSMQAAIGVERQLPRNTTASMFYTYNRSEHLAQTVPINSPEPGPSTRWSRSARPTARSLTATTRATFSNTSPAGICGKRC